jgi:3'(2'), 5'-bisphosphate nucleotidase
LIGNRPDSRHVLEEVLAISARASAAIREIYKHPFEVEFKIGDDPVTLADRQANEIIVAGLTAAFPGIPVVAEESDPASYALWREASAVWFVDPLDGTRDFVKRNGEFAVMIGLAEHGRATLGVIECPADGRRFAGAADGAWEVMPDGVWRKLSVSSIADPKLAHMVVSRSRPSDVLDRVGARLGLAKTTKVGSAGLKALRVACGEADVYAHVGQAGYRWDACAPEAIARGAGAKITDIEGNAYDYAAEHLENATGIVVSNGLLHDAALAAIAEAKKS